MSRISVQDRRATTTVPTMPIALLDLLQIGPNFSLVNSTTGKSSRPSSFRYKAIGETRRQTLPTRNFAPEWPGGRRECPGRVRLKASAHAPQAWLDTRLLLSTKDGVFGGTDVEKRAREPRAIISAACWPRRCRPFSTAERSADCGNRPLHQSAPCQVEVGRRETSG